MGVKSTKFLTRIEAERKFSDLFIQLEAPRIIRDRLGSMEDDELEVVIEEMNDRANGGKGFEIYIIGEDRG